VACRCRCIARSRTKTNDVSAGNAAVVCSPLHWTVRVARALRRLQRVRVWISSLKNRRERSYRQRHLHFITCSLLLSLRSLMG
jgi:hypothetical protein